MIKGAIFDVDGTLLDSMEIWEDVGVRYLNSIGIEAEPDLGTVLFTKNIIICPRSRKKLCREFWTSSAIIIRKPHY